MEQLLLITNFADILDNDLLRFLVQIAAYITPFFLIPATFKFGMGVFGNLTGMINDRSRGVFDRQRKFREASKQSARQNALTGNRLKGGTDTNFRGRLNRGIANTLNAPGAVTSSGNTFKPTNWAAATRTGVQSRNLAEIERNMKENQAYQSWMHDDGLNRAASESRNAAELRSNLINSGYAQEGSRDLEDAVARVETVRRSMGTDAFAGMTARQAIAGGTAFKSSSNPEDPKTAAGEVWLAAAKASLNDDAMASYLVANGRSEGMKAGRIDYAGAGFGTTLGVVNQFRDKLKAGQQVTQEDLINATQHLHKDVYEGQGGASLVHSSMKLDTVKDMAPEMIRTVDSAVQTGTSRDITQRFASLAAVYDGMQGSSPVKARYMADNVLSQKVDLADLSPEMKERLRPALRQADGSTQELGQITYQKIIDGLRGNNEFKEMRREYANDIDRVLGQQPPEPGTRPGQL